MSTAHKYWGISLLILALVGPLTAQNKLAYSEFGFGVGTLNYSGDIATTTSASSLLKETRPNFSAFAKRHFNDWFSLGILASYGSIYANDANHTHQNRGLEVSTSMFQINPFFEINIIKFGKFHYDRKFSVFLRAGGASSLTIPIRKRRISILRSLIRKSMRTTASTSLEVSV